MSEGRRRRALEALILTRDFRAQLEMAKEMIEASSGSLRDALRLTAGYAAFFGSASDDPEFATLTNLAAGSSDSSIATAAQNFLAAVTAPTTFDQLALGYQVFETLFIDLRMREKYGNQALVLSGAVQSIFAALAAGTDPQRLDKMSRSLAIAAEAGFQGYNVPLMDWAMQQAVDFGLETTEAGLTPRYFRASFTYASDDFAAALVELDPVFSSLIASNVAADAGLVMAQCFLQLNDDLGALAALELVQANYPATLFAVQEAAKLEAFIRVRTDPPGPLVEAVIEKQFNERLKQALARGELESPGPAQVALIADEEVN
jgi:hypothetical protein